MGRWENLKRLQLGFLLHSLALEAVQPIKTLGFIMLQPTTILMPFLSPPVLMHGGLLGVAFCPSVCLPVRDWTKIHQKKIMG